jgi:hypothetical protein
VGFRVKSDLRNHQAIVQPRLYDSLMVTQITLKRRSLFHVACWPGPVCRAGSAPSAALVDIKPAEGTVTFRVKLEACLAASALCDAPMLYQHMKPGPRPDRARQQCQVESGPQAASGT